MTAGTIVLTNKSADVTGSGTAFSNELKPNDFLVAVVGGVTYTLGVKSVASDTTLTLNKAYDGPDASGLAWTPVPNAALVGITSQVAADVARAIRGLNMDKANWQQVFSEDRNITVILPDGSTFTGPSWLRVVELLKDIDLDGLKVVADQIDADAKQVATDKTTASNAATTATNAAKTSTEKAAAAAGSATSAAQSASDAGTSKSAAAGSATAATQQADRAKTEADRAAGYAGDMDFTMSDVRAYVDAVCPVGMRMDWPQAKLPDNDALGIKYLRLTGASFDKNAYPKLAAAYPSGVLPDMRGDTIRGYDDGRGIDQGRTLLSEQQDAAPNITGSLGMRPLMSSGTNYTNRLSQSGALLGYGLKDYGSTLQGQLSDTANLTRNVEDISFDASRSSGVYGRADEVRMRNMAWNMIVRAA